MLLNFVNLNNQSICTNQSRKISFTSSKWLAPKAYRIEQSILSNYGIESEFKNNSFMAECVEKTLKVFKDNFGRWALPSNIEASEINDTHIYAYYRSYDDIVAINKNKKCFNNEDKLKQEMRNHKNLFFLPDWFSTIHPLHIFIHELAHSAHYHNLERMGNPCSLALLRYTMIPTSIGRLIAKFKLSKYAATNMNEFMAERITKDVINNLTSQGRYIGNAKDLNYSKIFENKWNYRYSSPQAYIDYYTQQVWNGDLEEARKTGEKIEVYLKKIDSQNVPEIVRQLQVKTKEKPLLGSLAKGLSSVFENVTSILDKKNNLRLGNKLD